MPIVEPTRGPSNLPQKLLKLKKTSRKSQQAMTSMKRICELQR